MRELSIEQHSQRLTYQYSYFWVHGTDFWESCDEEVNPFAVYESGHANDSH